jgi:hypothetical protein
MRTERRHGVKSPPPVSRKLSLPSYKTAIMSVTPSCSEPPTIVYSTTAVTATPDNHISIEPPHYTSVIDKDFETTDIPKPSACSEFTASFRLPYGSKYTCTSSIVADPTPPKKTDVARLVAHYKKVLRTLWLSYKREVTISWKRVAETLLVPIDTRR